MNIKLIKRIDSILGVLLVRILPLPKPSQKASNGIRKILLVRPGGIGDAVLLVPAISSLRAMYPGVAVDVLAERRNAGVFLLVPDVNNVFLYDKMSDLLSVLRSSYDIVIDTEQWHRLSAVVSRLISSGLRIGFGTNERGRLFSTAVDYSQDVYEAECFLKLLKPLGGDASFVHGNRFLEVSPVSMQWADEQLASLEDNPFVVLFPGASITERQWGAGKFTELAKRLTAERLGVVVVGGHEDKPQGDAIVNGLDRAVNLAGGCTLAESAAVIEKARLLVSGDSGVLHLGVGVGTPTVSLFGPGIAAKWAPRGDRHVVIDKKLDCSPCTRFGNTPDCPIHAACMKMITVDDVHGAVQELLGKDETAE